MRGITMDVDDFIQNLEWLERTFHDPRDVSRPVDGLARGSECCQEAVVQDPFERFPVVSHFSSNPFVAERDEFLLLR